MASGSFKTRGHLHQVFYEPNVRNGRDLGGYKHTRDNYSYKSVKTTVYNQTNSGTYQERIIKIGATQQEIDDYQSIMLK